MIEWVPIKDFKDMGGVLYLFLYEHKSNIYRDPIITSGVYRGQEQHHIFTGHEMTHAALLTLPVEKTLEEKFEAAFPGNGTVYDRVLMINTMAQIAKQHYEGEK